MPHCSGQREAQQMGVGRAVGVGLDLADGLLEPGPVVGVAAVDVEGVAGPGLLGGAHGGLLTLRADGASRGRTPRS